MAEVSASFPFLHYKEFIASLYGFTSHPIQGSPCVSNFVDVAILNHSFGLPMYQQPIHDDGLPSDVDLPTEYSQEEFLDDSEDLSDYHNQKANYQRAEIPEAIRTFIVFFYQSVQDAAMFDLHSIYENIFNRMTEKYYAKQPWPEANAIASLVDNDTVFLTLYRELYYRHIYNKLTPTLANRVESYQNYCDLFNYILNSTDGPVMLDLPNQWLWDIIDEFIYQFQSFCQYRVRIKNKTEEEIVFLRENPQVWNCYSVLNVLYSLIQKSKINEQLLVTMNGGDIGEAAGEYGTKPLYKMLGYFSIIGLLRVHCLLGDYSLALKVMDNIEMNKKALFARVTACHITAYYYVGFAYMMMQRYSDAIKAFAHILTFITRTKQFHTRSYQYDQIVKKGDQMYALLAICIALCPTRLDENVHSTLREKYGEQLSKLQKGDDGVAVAKDLFLYACPKFISPTFDDIIHHKLDSAMYQCSIFLSSFKSQMMVPVIRSYLKLYTKLGVDKLASYLGVSNEEVRYQLMIFKNKTRMRKWVSGSLLEGEMFSTSDLDFCVKADKIHVAELKIGRRYGDWFIRNLGKFEDILASLNRDNLAV